MGRERPQVVAHRGSSSEKPEHTLSAYLRAIEQGADALECDVRLTADGHLVCVHDRTVNRTSNGRGVVSTLELAHLEGLDWGSWKEDWASADDVESPDRDAGRLLTADSTSSSDGKGTVQRQENLQTSVAAVVTQLLPNGNLVVEGKQEIRVNFEVRELVVAGIVRPEDIQSDNTIDSSKIAQARIAYGGRGQLTDVQQPRYGQQVLDVLLPF